MKSTCYVSVICVTFLLTIFPSTSVDALLVCLSGKTVEGDRVDDSIFNFCERFSDPGEERIDLIVRADNFFSAFVSCFERRGGDEFCDGTDLKTRDDLKKEVSDAATRAVSANEPITIIGYSWGGYNAAYLQRALADKQVEIRTNLLITIDAIFGATLNVPLTVAKEFVDLAINIKQSADTRPVQGLTLLGDNGKTIINIDVTEELRKDIPDGPERGGIHDHMDDLAKDVATFIDTNFPNAAPVIRDSVVAAIQQALPNLFQCGNNVLEFGEECDDGDNLDGDGCSSACKVEEEICGNPYADAVVSHTTPAAPSLPTDILGVPDGLTASFDNDGSTPGFVVVSFTDNIVVDGNGPDLAVHLIDFFTGDPESFKVLGGADGTDFRELTVVDCSPLAFPNLPKTCLFDLVGTGLTTVTYVMIRNDAVIIEHPFEGPDIDAIEALNCGVK